MLREWRHEPFLDLGLEAAVHAGDVIFQPGMFCGEGDSSARVLCTTRRLQHLIAQVPQRHITHLQPGRKADLPSTLHSSVSSWTCPGSRLSLIVPSNRAASCGMMASRRRKSSSPIVEVFNASMLILPSLGSMIRNRARVSELFPAPVRPTTPIFSWGLISRLMPLSTRSKPSRCLLYTSPSPRD